MTNKVADQTQVSLTPDVLVKARGRARALGLTLAEYMKNLVDKDVATIEDDPWRQPVPPEVNAQWDKEIAEFDEEEKIKPHKTYFDAEEFVKDMQTKA